MRGSSVAILLLTLLVAGCATSRATINTFVDPAFSKGSIERLAVFPIRNARFAPSEAQQLNRRISTVIHAKNPAIELISSVEVINSLNERELADDWATFLDNYVASGVPDANALREIGTAVGVDAIMQGEIVNVFQQDGSYGGSKGQTRVTVRYTLLDCRDGRLLWEASSDGVKTTATTLDHAPPIIEAVQLAMDKILDNVPL